LSSCMFPPESLKETPSPITGEGETISLSSRA
jgi:hypothetical protein